MSTQTETHRFSNLPLVLTGNAVVTRLTGEVMWKLRQNSDGTYKILNIFHVYLKTEDGGLVEIIHDEALWNAVYEALTQEVRTLTHSKARREDATPLSTDKISASNNLDNAATEGAQQTSG
jgi:hypothetical protein